MFQQRFDDVLSIGDAFFTHYFFMFELCRKLSDFFLFLVKNFKFLRIFSLFLRDVTSKVIFNISDRFSISINHLTAISDFLLLHLNFSIVLLNTVHEPLTCLREGQVHLIGL